MMGETPKNSATMTHRSSMHGNDMSFMCIECGTDIKDVEVTNGHIRPGSAGFRCQTCRTDPSKVNREDLKICCEEMGCYSTSSYEDLASVINRLRQVHKGDEDLLIACLIGCDNQGHGCPRGCPRGCGEVILSGHTTPVIEHFRQVHPSYCDPKFEGHRNDISFRCIDCGTNIKDVRITNGHVRPPPRKGKEEMCFRCQTCRTDTTKLKSEDLEIFCGHGCYSTSSYEDLASVINRLRQVHKEEEDLYVTCLIGNCLGEDCPPHCLPGCGGIISSGYTAPVVEHFRQIHTSFCDPTYAHVGYDENGKPAIDHKEQAHSDTKAMKAEAEIASTKNLEKQLDSDTKATKSEAGSTSSEETDPL